MQCGAAPLALAFQASTPCGEARQFCFLCFLFLFLSRLFFCFSLLVFSFYIFHRMCNSCLPYPASMMTWHALSTTRTVCVRHIKPFFLVKPSASGTTSVQADSILRGYKFCGHKTTPQRYLVLHCYAEKATQCRGIMYCVPMYCCTPRISVA